MPIYECILMIRIRKINGMRKLNKYFILLTSLILLILLDLLIKVALAGRLFHYRRDLLFPFGECFFVESRDSPDF